MTLNFVHFLDEVLNYNKISKKTPSSISVFFFPLPYPSPSLFTLRRISTYNGATMATLEAALSVFSGNPRHPQRFVNLNPLTSLKLQFSLSASPSLSQKFLPLPPFPTSNGNGPSLQLCFSVQDMEVEAETESGSDQNIKRKLYVVNLPWSLSVVDIKNLFGECGNVKDVEVRRFVKCIYIY